MSTKKLSTAARTADVKSESNLTIDRTNHTIILVRSFDAPRELIFDSWTQPEQVLCWWDPTGAPLAECEIDLRRGGAFKFVYQTLAGAHPFTGLYREIARPTRLVFEAMGAVGKVILEERGGTTLMTVSITCASKAAFDHFLTLGVDRDTARTLDNLIAYVRAKWS